MKPWSTQYHLVTKLGDNERLAFQVTLHIYDKSRVPGASVAERLLVDTKEFPIDVQRTSRKTVDSDYSLVDEVCLRSVVHQGEKGNR